MQQRVFLGLGANLCDRLKSLREAIIAIKAIPGVNFKRQSRVYQTTPMHILDQPDFLNMVIEIEVDVILSARDLLIYIKDIELDLGRVRRRRWGPREIDIDILLFDGQHIIEEELEIPHPRMWDRAFVIVPLAELAPDLITPTGETIGRLAERLAKEQGIHATLQL